MSLILIILLVIFFGYSLALVLANNSTVAINLLFIEVPTTNLGLVLILTISLGIIVGILLSLQLFRVLQNKLELRRLKKELDLLKGQLADCQSTLAQTQHSHSLANNVTDVTSDH